MHKTDVTEDSQPADSTQHAPTTELYQQLSDFSHPVQEAVSAPAVAPQLSRIVAPHDSVKHAADNSKPAQSADAASDKLATAKVTVPVQGSHCEQGNDTEAVLPGDAQQPTPAAGCEQSVRKSTQQPAVNQKLKNMLEHCFGKDSGPDCTQSEGVNSDCMESEATSAEVKLPAAALAHPASADGVKPGEATFGSTASVMADVAAGAAPAAGAASAAAATPASVIAAMPAAVTMRDPIMHAQAAENKERQSRRLSPVHRSHRRSPRRARSTAAVSQADQAATTAGPSVFEGKRAEQAVSAVLVVDDCAVGQAADSGQLEAAGAGKQTSHTHFLEAADETGKPAAHRHLPKLDHAVKHAAKQTVVSGSNQAEHSLSNMRQQGQSSDLGLACDAKVQPATFSKSKIPRPDSPPFQAKSPQGPLHPQPKFPRIKHTVLLKKAARGAKGISKHVSSPTLSRCSQHILPSLIAKD